MSKMRNYEIYKSNVIVLASSPCTTFNSTIEFTGIINAKIKDGQAI